MCRRLDHQERVLAVKEMIKVDSPGGAGAAPFAMGPEGNLRKMEEVDSLTLEAVGAPAERAVARAEATRVENTQARVETAGREQAEAISSRDRVTGAAQSAVRTSLRARVIASSAARRSRAVGLKAALLHRHGGNPR